MDWDEVMQWDRDYARKVLKSDLMMGVLPLILAGKSVEEQIEQVKRDGIFYPIPSLRNAVIGGLEIRPKKVGAKAKNLIKVGCACYGNLSVLRYYCLLLDKLGVDYTFLDKEYCCLAIPLYQVLGQGKDRREIDELSKQSLERNLEQARKQGGENILYFCPWCVYKADWYFHDSDIKQLYAFDALTQPELWEGKELHLNKRVGYFGGEPPRRTVYCPDDSVRIDWNSYRAILDRIEGLEVVDMPHVSCQHCPPKGIWRWMEERDLDTIVLSCPSGYASWVRRAPEGFRVRYIPDILLEALGGPAW